MREPAEAALKKAQDAARGAGKGQVGGQAETGQFDPLQAYARLLGLGQAIRACRQIDDQADPGAVFMGAL